MRWSKEEEEFLTENWGNLSIKAIAKKLNRSKNAIEVRKNRLGLGSFLENRGKGKYYKYIKRLFYNYEGNNRTNTRKL